MAVAIDCEGSEVLMQKWLFLTIDPKIIRVVHVKLVF